MNPIPTTAHAISDGMPKREHAIGIRSRDPPATPDAPHAPRAATKHKRIFMRSGTSIPRVLTQAKVITVIVIAAPAMLMVAPSGMEVE